MIHLARLKREGIQVEIILVDNQSTDDTAQFAKKIWTELMQPFPMVIVSEQKQGLSYARFSGVQNANFDLIVFCDDDNWLDEDYLLEAKSIMNSQSTVAALGGYGAAAAEVEMPEWFEAYKGGYAISDDSFESGILSEGIYLTGAGLVFRKALFIKAFENLPSLLTDRAGSQLTSGGDTEICLRFKLMGYQLCYDTRLKFKHFIPKERLTIAYRDRLFAGFEDHKEVIEYYQKLIGLIKLGSVAKFIIILSVIVKLPFTSFKLIKRWELKRDLISIYILTGIDFLQLPNNWKVIKKLYEYK